jgi:two-component system sensor histidine kinase/response regulator
VTEKSLFLFSGEFLLKKKIILIEDDEIIRENTAYILKAKGYDVDTADDGIPGIQKILENKPDLVICDIMMPNMDGYEVLESVRSNKNLSLIPFIFLTAKTDMRDLRKGMSEGADDYIVKPFSSEDLLKSVETRLDKFSKMKTHIENQIDTYRQSIGNVYSHELRTPLNAIIGFTDLMIDYYDTFSKDEIIDMIRDVQLSGNRLYRTSDNLMWYFKIQNNEFKSSGDNLNISEKFIGFLCDDLSNSFHRGGDLSLKIETASLKVGEVEFNKIFDEIINNAFKFSEKGNKIKIEGKSEAGKYKIFVVDEGKGFDVSKYQIVSPFSQIDRDINEQQGLGLGFYLAKRLIEFFGGELKINSRPDYGTTIELTFNLSN